MAHELDALLKSGINLADRQAVNAVINTDEAIAASLDLEFSPTEEVEGEPAASAEDTIAALTGKNKPVAPTVSSNAVDGATGVDTTTGALEMPVPTAIDDTVVVDTTAAELAAMRAENEALKAQLAKQPVSTEPSAAAVARAAELQELIDFHGEDHVAVRRAKRENAEADTREKAEATQESNSTLQQQTATHNQLLPEVPFLQSLYAEEVRAIKSKDERARRAVAAKISAATTISERILKDPKLAGKGAAVPFTRDHYREIEAHMLELFPAAKAQFYGDVPAGNRPAGKVVSLGQIRGGSVPAQNVRQDTTEDDAVLGALSGGLDGIDKLLDATRGRG